MLVLQRKVDERIVMECDGRRIEVLVIDTHRGKASIGITAPSDVLIYRSELLTGEQGK